MFFLWLQDGQPIIDQSEKEKKRAPLTAAARGILLSWPQPQRPPPMPFFAPSPQAAAAAPPSAPCDPAAAWQHGAAINDFRPSTAPTTHACSAPREDRCPAEVLSDISLDDICLSPRAWDHPGLFGAAETSGASDGGQQQPQPFQSPWQRPANAGADVQQSTAVEPSLRFLDLLLGTTGEGVATAPPPEPKNDARPPPTTEVDDFEVDMEALLGMMPEEDCLYL